MIASSGFLRHSFHISSSLISPTQTWKTQRKSWWKTPQTSDLTTLKQKWLWRRRHRHRRHKSGKGAEAGCDDCCAAPERAQRALRACSRLVRDSFIPSFLHFFHKLDPAAPPGPRPRSRPRAALGRFMAHKQTPQQTPMAEPRLRPFKAKNCGFSWLKVEPEGNEMIASSGFLRHSLHQIKL